MNNKLILAAIFSSAIAGGASADVAAAVQQEKCYSIAKVGMNDCAAADGSHSCKGYATKDASPVDHILLPTGLCNKIVGASLAAPRV